MINFVPDTTQDSLLHCSPPPNARSHQYRSWVHGTEYLEKYISILNRLDTLAETNTVTGRLGNVAPIAGVRADLLALGKPQAGLVLCVVRDGGAVVPAGLAEVEAAAEAALVLVHRPLVDEERAGALARDVAEVLAWACKSSLDMHTTWVLQLEQVLYRKRMPQPPREESPGSGSVRSPC